MNNHHLHHLVKCFLYVMVADSEDSPEVKYFKIGISYQMSPRIASVQTGCPMKIKSSLCVQMPTRRSAIGAEGRLHKLLAGFNTSGEWFRFDMTAADHKQAFKLATRAVLDPILGPDWKWEVITLDELKEYRASRAASNPRYPTGKDLIAHAYRMVSKQPMW